MVLMAYWGTLNVIKIVTEVEPVESTTTTTTWQPTEAPHASDNEYQYQIFWGPIIPRPPPTTEALTTTTTWQPTEAPHASDDEFQYHQDDRPW